MSFSGAGRVAVLILMTGPVVALESRPPGMTPVALAQTTPRVQTALLTISGTVVDGEGRPVPGARVTAWSSGVRREAVSTASGGFQIDGLPAGTFRVMAALGQFMASDSVQVVLNDARGEPLRLALKPRYGGDEGALDVQDRLQKAYDEAQARWRGRAPARYEFTVDVGCFCAFGRRPMSFRVAEGRATATVELTAEEARFYEGFDTIDELLAIVRDAIAIRPFRMSATFDSEFGFPASVSINPSSRVFDEELRFTVTNFRPLSAAASTRRASAPRARPDLPPGTATTLHRRTR